jgi:hypothetical protein
MKVKDLRELLETYNDEAVVLMSKDGEGNAYRHVAEVTPFEVYEIQEYDCKYWNCEDTCTEDHNEYYRADVPEDIDDQTVLMIWPNY